MDRPSPVAGKFPSFLFILHATGGHSGTICMQLAATWLQFECDWLPVACHFCMQLVASYVQSCQFFESTLPDELVELKNEETIKKS
jgi:hypothetical protein